MDDMPLCACGEAKIIKAVANDFRQDGQVFVAPEALWQLVQFAEHDCSCPGPAVRAPVAPGEHPSGVAVERDGLDK